MYRYYTCVYTCMYFYVYNIYYICNKYIQRADRQLAICNDMHMFPPYPNFIHFENCWYIKDQKSMHLAQDLNASINSVSCQAEKENKTGLGQGIFLLHCLFKKIYFILDVDQESTSSKFRSDLGSLILHPYIKLMTNKVQALPCKAPEKFSVVCGDYFSAASNIHQS